MSLSALKKSDPQDPVNSTKTPIKGEVLSFIKTILTIVVIVFVVRGTLIEPFKIPSGSMIPTLKIHDHILVSKLSYGLRLPFVTNSLFNWSTPKRGDVVVFTRPDEPGGNEDESSINLIKRVVGLPGETLEVRGTTLYINGKPLDEPYARWVESGRPDGNFGPQTIPENHVILLGDNRDQSRDSRFWLNPFLDIDRIKGRAIIIYFTFDPEFFGRIGKIIR